MKAEKFMNAVNLPRHIADHVIGEKHTQAHRRVFGGLLLIIGVGLAHASSHIANLVVSILGDLVGYSIHGTGLIPFLHDLEKIANNKKQDSETLKTTNDAEPNECFDCFSL